jgi:uncharacterized protein (TIGR03435 family)
MVPRVLISIVLTAFIVAGLSAQGPRFASATIRPSGSAPDDRPVSHVTEDGGYLATNVTLKRLIEDAYRRSGFDRRAVIGGPAWIASDRFEVVAQGRGLYPDADGFPRTSLRMLQELLQERFQIRVGVEEQSRPVYVLVLTTAMPGPRLVPSALDCAAIVIAQAKGERGGKMCGAAPYPGRLIAAGVTLADLAALIEPYVDRPVIDRTGIFGVFDLDLEGVEFQPRGPFGPSYRPSDTKQSVFDLIGPQLGLKLERTTGVTEVLKVESAEKLSPR